MVQKNDDDRMGLWKNFEKSGTLGFTVVIGILLMSFAGIKLDQYFDTGVIFTIVLFIWGLVSAFIFLYYRFKKMGQDK